ncbi:uncharacterized protein LOC144155462 isoform X2 [Haemaphysalis longicornis]
MATKSTKGVRKLERPRPLRLNSDSERCSSTVVSPAESVSTLSDSSAPCAFTEEEVINELEILHVSVNNGNFDETVSAQIGTVCAMLMVKGAAIDSSNKEVLDCYFVTLRNAARDERLDACSRMKLLQMIELRGMGWKWNENIRDFYRKMILQLAEGQESELSSSYSTTCSTNCIASCNSSPCSSSSPCNSSSCNSSPPQISYGAAPPQQPQQQQQQQLQQQQSAHLLSAMAPASSPPLSLQPTEVLKSSGKFGKPAKIPGRNFLKDEIVIRNSDSGKVNPGVRDRLVQITGPNEETIMRAKELIEDTIRRNASPVREVGDETATSYAGAKETNQKPSLMHSYSMGDASVGEFSSVVNVARDSVRLSGTNPVLLKTVKLVVEKYFAGEMEFSDKVAAELLAQQNYAAYASSEPIIHESGWRGINLSSGPNDLSGPTDLSGINDLQSSQTSSSSEEETFREDGCPKPEEKTVAAQSPKHVTKSASIVKNLPAQVAAKTAGPVDAPEQSKQIKRSGSSPEFSAKAERSQVPSSASVEASDPPAGAFPAVRSYSRDFLLQCSQSEIAVQLPLDFPALDPEVANLMVKQEKTVAAQSPKHVTKSASIVKNLPAQVAAKTAGPVDAPEQSKQIKRSGSSPEFSAKAERPQVPSSASVEASDPPAGAPPAARTYSRGFLLRVSQLSISFQLPPDFPALDPQIENLMVKQHITPFDSDKFRQRMMRQASVSNFASGSPVSSTPPRSDLSEVEDSTAA